MMEAGTKKIGRGAASVIAAMIVIVAIGSGAYALGDGLQAGDMYGLGPKMAPFVKRGAMPGAVFLVADRTGIRDMASVGLADVAAGKPMRADDLFWIASMTKSMTASALMMLVDEGKVHLDDPVDKYLPEFAPRSWADKSSGAVVLRPLSSKITVREILTHTSGLPYNTSAETPTLDMLSLKDRIPSYSAANLLFDPGTGYNYSNAGINTAGRIVEAVSGMPYEEFMSQRLFGPLGMDRSTFHPRASDIPNIPLTYVPDAGSGWRSVRIAKLHYPLDDPARQPIPGNGLFSTASDVAKFCMMLLNNGVAANGKRILSAEAVKAITTRETPAGMKQNYGFGMEVYANGYGHGGTDHTSMRVDTSRGIISVFLVQMATTDNARWSPMQQAWQSAAASVPAR